MQYSAYMWIADQEDIGWTSESDRKLMALTFAAFRLSYDANDSRQDRRIWKQLLKAVGVPRTLPYEPLAALLEKAKHDYSGNTRMARAYGRKLTRKQREALDNPLIGRRAGANVAVA